MIRGRVQGVGFRYFTKRLADDLALKGWVRNLPTGGVEVVAAGNEKDLESLEKALRNGPPAARVEAIEASSLSAFDQPERFEIVR